MDVEDGAAAGAVGGQLSRDGPEEEDVVAAAGAVAAGALTTRTGEDCRSNRQSLTY